MKSQYIEESPFSRILFSNTKLSMLWLIIRVYVGWQWLVAGWEKVNSSAWVGGSSGSALAGFVKGALSKTSGPHPDVQGWYAAFLEHSVLPHSSIWSEVIAYGELLVGIALIIGILTGIAAFFGLFMNLNYMLAGTISVNPILFILSLGLLLAWRIAGYWGIDRYFLPYLGVPWHRGKVFQ